MYNTILVPTDGSDAAEDAARHAMELASAFDATVHALYVVDNRYAWADSGAIPVLLETLEETGKEATDSIKELGERNGVTVTTTVEHGSPPRQILDHAAEHGIDLIVMGSHGRTGLERTLIGSVTEKTVRSSSTPVLVVKRSDNAVYTV